MTAASIFLKPPAKIDQVTPWLRSLSYVLTATILTASLTLALPKPPLSDDGGSEIVIEFAPITADAASEAATDAAEVAADDQQATPEVDEVLSRKSDDDRPAEQVSPTEPNEPDLAMARERTQQEQDYKVEERQATEAMISSSQSVSSAQSVASDASLGREPEHEQQRAPNEGVNDAQARRRLEDWQRKLFTHIGRHKAYPDEARAKKLSGDVLVAFELDRDGKILSAQIARSSGHKVLDEAAIAVMRKANPLPPLPFEVRGTTARLTLPMKFTMSKGQ